MKKLLTLIMIIGLTWSTWFMFREHDWIGVGFAGVGWICVFLLWKWGAFD